MPNKPLSLSEADIDAICEFIAKGGSVNLALRLLGKSPTTYYKYLKDAKNYVELGIVPDRYHSEEYLSRLEYLYFALQKADAEGELAHIENMNRLAKEENNIRASEFMLERRYGWRKPASHVVYHNDVLDEAMQLEEVTDDLGKLTEAQLLRLAAVNVVEGEIVDESDD
jgi:hypothetical protein